MLNEMLLGDCSKKIVAVTVTCLHVILINCYVTVFNPNLSLNVLRNVVNHIYPIHCYGSCSMEVYSKKQVASLYYIYYIYIVQVLEHIMCKNRWETEAAAALLSCYMLQLLCTHNSGSKHLI